MKQQKLQGTRLKLRLDDPIVVRYNSAHQAYKRACSVFAKVKAVAGPEYMRSMEQDVTYAIGLRKFKAECKAFSEERAIFQAALNQYHLAQVSQTMDMTTLIGLMDSAKPLKNDTKFLEAIAAENSYENDPRIKAIRDAALARMQSQTMPDPFLSTTDQIIVDDPALDYVQPPHIDLTESITTAEETEEKEKPDEKATDSD